MEVRNVTDEVQTIHKGTVLGVAFQAVEMKPWVDVDLKNSAEASADVKTGSTGAPSESTGMPAGPTGVPAEPTDMQNSHATVHRINVRPPMDGEAMSIDLPEHVQELYDKHHTDMVPEDQKLYKELLWKYSQIFAKSKTDLGRTDMIKHHIETGDERPFKHKPRRLPQAKFDEMKKTGRSYACAGSYTSIN